MQLNEVIKEQLLVEVPSMKVLTQELEHYNGEFVSTGAFEMMISLYPDRLVWNGIVGINVEELRPLKKRQTVFRCPKCKNFFGKLPPQQCKLCDLEFAPF